jgi:queuine tRNA-ribosyltransferase
MGVGTPEDLVAAVSAGIDMFDCVLPTRNARNGHFFTRHGDVRIRNAATRTTRGRLTKAAPAIPAGTFRAPTCTTSTAVGEILGAQLGTLHNLHYYQELMRELRTCDCQRHAGGR